MSSSVAVYNQIYTCIFLVLYVCVFAVAHNVWLLAAAMLLPSQAAAALLPASQTAAMLSVSDAPDMGRPQSQAAATAVAAAEGSTTTPREELKQAGESYMCIDYHNYSGHIYGGNNCYNICSWLLSPKN